MARRSLLFETEDWLLFYPRIEFVDRQAVWLVFVLQIIGVYKQGIRELRRLHAVNQRTKRNRRTKRNGSHWKRYFAWQALDPPGLLSCAAYWRIQAMNQRRITNQRTERNESHSRINKNFRPASIGTTRAVIRPVARARCLFSYFLGAEFCPSWMPHFKCSTSAQSLSHARSSCEARRIPGNNGINRTRTTRGSNHTRADLYSLSLLSHLFHLLVANFSLHVAL